MSHDNDKVAQSTKTVDPFEAFELPDSEDAAKQSIDPAQAAMSLPNLTIPADPTAPNRPRSSPITDDGNDSDNESEDSIIFILGDDVDDNTLAAQVQSLKVTMPATLDCPTSSNAGLAVATLSTPFATSPTAVIQPPAADPACMILTTASPVVVALPNPNQMQGQTGKRPMLRPTPRQQRNCNTTRSNVTTSSDNAGMRDVVNEAEFFPRGESAGHESAGNHRKDEEVNGPVPASYNQYCSLDPQTDNTAMAMNESDNVATELQVNDVNDILSQILANPNRASVDSTADEHVDPITLEHEPRHNIFADHYMVFPKDPYVYKSPYLVPKIEFPTPTYVDSKQVQFAEDVFKSFATQLQRYTEDLHEKVLQLQGQLLQTQLQPVQVSINDLAASLADLRARIIVVEEVETKANLSQGLQKCEDALNALYQKQSDITGEIRSEVKADQARTDTAIAQLKAEGRQNQVQTEKAITKVGIEMGDKQTKTDTALTQFKVELKEALSQLIVGQRNCTAELKTAIDVQHNDLKNLTTMVTGLRSLILNTQPQPQPTTIRRFLKVSISLSDGSPIANIVLHANPFILEPADARHIVDLIKVVNRQHWRSAQTITNSTSRVLSLDSILVLLEPYDTETSAIIDSGKWNDWVNTMIARSNFRNDIQMVFSPVPGATGDSAPPSKKRKHDGDTEGQADNEDTGRNIFRATGW